MKYGALKELPAIEKQLLPDFSLSVEAIIKPPVFSICMHPTCQRS